MRQWCHDAGGNIEIVYETLHKPIPPTNISSSNVYWIAFKQATDELWV